MKKNFYALKISHYILLIAMIIFLIPYIFAHGDSLIVSFMILFPSLLFVVGFVILEIIYKKHFSLEKGYGTKILLFVVITELVSIVIMCCLGL